MKTAIAIDSLIKRDESIFLLELLLHLFPNSEIYTISHKQGGILGQVETRPIVSSYLTHKTKDVGVFKKNYWILPSAVKGIPLHKSIEKIIIISRGFIHGLEIPDHVEKHLYILDWDLVDNKNLGWQRVFQSYVENWKEKNLTNFPRIAVSSNALKNKLDLPNAEVLYPTYRTEEYPFVRDEDHHFLFTHHLIHTDGFSSQEFKVIVQFLLDKNETVRVLGPDAHLKQIINHPRLEFGGDHCEATSALYSHQAKCVWDFSESFFPATSFGALATGRPVIVRENALNREFLSEGSFFLDSLDELEPLYQKIEESYLSFDRKKLRRLGLKWNERLFKSKISQFVGKNKF